MADLSKHEIRDIYYKHTLKVITILLTIIAGIIGYLLIDRHDLAIKQQAIENKQIDLIIQITKLDDNDSQMVMLKMLEELYPINKSSPAMKNFLSAIKKGIIAKNEVISEIDNIKNQISNERDKIKNEAQKKSPDQKVIKASENYISRLSEQKNALQMMSKEIPIAVTAKINGLEPRDRFDVAIVVTNDKARPGALNKNYMKYEFEYNQELSLLVQNALNSLNISSKRIFPNDYGKLWNLPTYINSLQPSLMVALYVNAFNGSVSGSSVQYKHGSISGKNLANILLNEIVSTMNLPNRRIHPKTIEDRGGYSLNYVNCTAVNIHPFFIDNDSDLKVALDRKKDLAQAIAKGIKEFLDTGDID